MRSSMIIGLALMTGLTSGCGGGEPALLLGPPGANTFDDLVVQMAGADESKFSFEWSLDGEVVDDLSGTSVPADRTTKRDEWTVTATRGETVVSATIEVGNAPPAAQVSIEPAGPTATDDVLAKGTATDPDPSDAPYVEYAWERQNPDGTWAPSGAKGSKLSAEATRLGEIWRVAVTPRDGDGAGPTGFLQFEIGNAPPVIDEVTVQSVKVNTNDVISVSAKATDADGDAIELKYRWMKDSGSGAVEIAGQLGNTLDGETQFDAGDEIYAEVWGFDGRSDGPAKASPLIEVVNGAPGAPAASVAPEAPFEDEDLVCSLVETTQDPDGDEVKYRVEWQVDGAPFVASTTTVIEGDTVPASATSSQETWTCNLVAYDDSGAERVGTAEVFVDARSGCLDGTTDVDWNTETEGCLVSTDGSTTITWAEARDNYADYCAPGWEFAKSDVVNGVLAGPGYTDSWFFAFDGEGCNGYDHWASRNDSGLSTNSTCLWRKSHFTSLSSEDGEVHGVMCVRSPEVP